jgi:hypothetical protein
MFKGLLAPDDKGLMKGVAVAIRVGWERRGILTH